MAIPIVMATESNAFGGVEIALLQLVERLDRTAFDVSVFLPMNDAVSPLLERLDDLRIPREAVPQPFGKYDPAFAARLVRHVRRRDAKLVHLHLAHLYGFEHIVPFLRLAGVPVLVATEQNGPYQSPRLKFLRDALKRSNVGSLDAVFAVSRELADLIIDNFGARSEKVWHLPNSVDTTIFRSRANAEDARLELGTPPDAPVILTVARLEHQKGVEFLLEAAVSVLQRFPAARFWIAGEGALRAQLEARAERSGVASAVRFLGFRSDLPRLFAAADIFVLASLYEGLPLSVLEAMASCRAIVATNVGGTPDVIKDGDTGLLVPPANSAALAKALIKLLSDSSLARRLAERAGVVAQEYSVDAAVEVVSRRYRILLEAKGIRS